MVGPTQPKKPYWYEGDKTLDNSKKYFVIFDKFKIRNQELTNEELETKNFVLYYDGSSYAGADQSGKDRFANGRKFAEENFEIGKKEALIFLASERERMVNLSHKDALKELLKMSKLDSKIKAIEKINSNNLFDIK